MAPRWVSRAHHRQYQGETGNDGTPPTQASVFYTRCRYELLSPRSGVKALDTASPDCVLVVHLYTPAAAAAALPVAADQGLATRSPTDCHHFYEGIT